MDKPQFHAIGKQSFRKDGIAKVTGQGIYTSDVILPGMLYGRVLRSPFPHAKIKKMDTRGAERVGVVCITFKDIPKVKYNERLVSMAVLKEKDGDLCKSCRVALGAVAGRPLGALKAEEMMRGEKFTEGLVRKLSQKASEEIRPITDLRSTDWYRKEVSKVLVRDAIHLAWNRASVGE